MTSNKLNVYPDSDFLPGDLNVTEKIVVDLTHLPIYEAKGEPVVKLTDLQQVDGILLPQIQSKSQAPREHSCCHSCKANGCVNSDSIVNSPDSTVLAYYLSFAQINGNMLRF